MKKDFLKKASTDFALTIGATVVLVGTLQLLVYPFLAWKLDGDRYGLFLVAIGIVNALEPSFGSTLCNTRIIRNERYEKAGIGPGDFKYLLSISAPVLAVATAIVCWQLLSMDLLMALAVGILTGMSIVKAYCLVAFRLHFNSKKLLLVNLLTALGYVVGMGVAFASGFWPFVFILGEAFALACFVRCSNVFSEPYGKTRLFGSSLRTYVSLIASNLITYSSVYVDRLLLYPALGPSAVSTYYVATFFGKTFSFFSSPISSIMLSYMSDGVVKITVRRYHLVNLFILAVGLFMYAIAFFIGPLFAMILYPTLYDQALSLMPLGNAASIFAVVNSFNMVVVLKVAPPRLQVVSSLFRLVLYAASIAFSSWVGSLWVLCLLMLISNAVSYLFTYSVGLFYMKRSGAMVRTGANS